MEFEDRVPKLIASYLRGDLTASQQKELDDWKNEKETNKLFFEEYTNEKLLREKLRDFNKKDKTSVLNNALPGIDNETISASKSRLVQIKRYMVAACLVVIAGTTVYILTRVSNQGDAAKTSTNTNVAFKNDVTPGTDKAILTLANGSTIQLNNSGNQKIADENGTAVNQQGAQLVYDASQSSSINPSTLSYNTLSTPRGGQFHLVLADGSRVWLNAVSSIRYPTAFTGKERNVEITGEAYFEVAHDAKPFKVLVNGMEVQVLGTHFNVNAYADEATINTTLLEGKIKVSKNTGSILLKPGQQAQLTNHDQLKLVENADMDAAVAWKNGMFSFNSADIKTVMQQISRWYDVEVVYAGEVKETFFVKMNRNTNVSNVFKILETTGGVHFDIDGKKITVKP